MNLEDLIAKLPRDKVLHVAGGAAVALVACLATGLPWVGVAAAAVAGIGKELYDRDRRESHSVELADAVATVVGGLVVAAAWAMLA